MVSPKKVGIPAATGYTARIIPNHPQSNNSAGAFSPGLSLYLTGQSAVGIITSAIGFGGSINTNGVKLFGSYTQTGASDNRVYVVSGLHNVAYTSAGYGGIGKLIVKG